MKQIHNIRIGRLIAVAILTIATFNFANAQIFFSSGTPYLNNFDSLGSAATAVWTDNSTLPGWYADRAGGTAAAGPIPTYIGGTGSGTTGGLYSWGVAGVNPLTDRALGSLSSGTPGTLAYGVAFTNDTAVTITNITVSYTGEQWRNGGNTAVQQLAFSYLKGSSALTSADPANTLVWTPVSSLTFNTPINTATAAALDGNAPANRTALSATLTGVTVGPGEAIFLRWVDINDSGNDHGVALDDLSVTWTTVAPNLNPPTITQQPVSVSNYAGNNVQFSVQATGKAPLNFQWYYTNAGNNILINGATGASLGLNTITNANAGQYYVIITNDVPGAITSSIVTLTVLPAVVTNIAYLHTLQDNVNFALTDTNTLYQITGIVTTPNLVVGSPAFSFYIQDATGGIDVFERGGFALLGQLPSDLPSVGQIVTVTATLGQFSGAIEVSPVAANPADSLVLSNNDSTIYPLPAPKVLDFASQSNFPLMETNYEGSLVVVSNVFLDQTLGVFATGATTTLLMTNASHLTMPLFNAAPATDAQGQPIPAFASSVMGVVIQNKASAPFTGSYEISLNLYSDINTNVPTGAPVPPTLIIHSSGGNLMLTWSDPSFSLQSSTNISGPYTTISAAASPYTDSPTNTATFYRLVH